MVGLFWKRANRHGGFWTIVSGLVVGVPLFLVKEVSGVWAASGLPGLHFTYMAVVMFMFGTGVLAAVSLSTAPPDYDRIAKHTFTRDIFRQDLQGLGLPWYEDFRYQGAVLLVFMAAMIIYFW